MPIGIDELDDFDEIETVDTVLNTLDSDESSLNLNTEDDFIQALLKSKGIEDSTKIKFEDDEGSIEEIDWNNLSNEEKLNIINQPEQESEEDDLDDNEILLINAIRESGLTPAEYLQKIQADGVNNYLQNSQPDLLQFQVDQLNDDELFIYDFMSRMGGVTEEEAREALEQAKSNESLFKKQIGAIRKEYQDAEKESIRQAQIEQEAYAQEQYNQFADLIAQQVDNFSDFSGYDLNMTNDDKLMLYDFITGVDGAGNNYFAKALSDPKILVRAAWLVLNGEQMINDITEYFQKEISNVRKESYKKGKEDKKSEVVYKNKESLNNNIYDDLD